MAAEEVHRPTTCGAPLGEELVSRPYTARWVIDVVPPDGGKGLVLVQTQHTYLETPWGCGHCIRGPARARRLKVGWGVQLSKWHLAGPKLVAVICALALRMRLSRVRIQEILHDLLGLAGCYGCGSSSAPPPPCSSSASAAERYLIASLARPSPTG